MVGEEQPGVGVVPLQKEEQGQAQHLQEKGTVSRAELISARMIKLGHRVWEVGVKVCPA